jgi:predicted RNA binding protein YcfA (HicA-like mRNA interferase family)
LGKSSSPVKASEFLRILHQDGWYVVRQAGGHLIMRHPRKTGQIVVPYHGAKEMRTGTLKKLWKEAGLSLEEL